MAKAKEAAAGEEVKYVEVVRDGYTFGRSGFPRGAALKMTKGQFDATQNINPTYVKEISKEEAEARMGTVQAAPLDPAEASLAPAAADQARQARNAADGEANALELGAAAGSPAQNARQVEEQLQEPQGGK